MNNRSSLILAVVVVGLIPYGLTLSTKLFRFGRRDNHNTREWQAQLEGWRKRAYWAHLNTFEGFPLFAVGVLLNLLPMSITLGAAMLAWTYVATRIAYAFAFIFDYARIRSLVWFVGFFAVLGLYALALIGLR